MQQLAIPKPVNVISVKTSQLATIVTDVSRAFMVTHYSAVKLGVVHAVVQTQLLLDTLMPVNVL